ncbi:MAG: endo-1,4-beta-xylanase [Oscillospiraceae bacterium]|nr:endo-1,4-beta-xylanase [Oscillospiraceae bacterium]
MEILKNSAEKIDLFRKKDIAVKAVKDGKPVCGAKVSVKMKNHQFLFGANCFMAGQYKNDFENQTYTKLFSELLNYGTLPFYWGSYEPKRGETEHKKLLEMAKWCKENNIKPKGHPLVWHTVCPKWLADEDDVGKLLQNRIKDIMLLFENEVGWWDVLNEITVVGQFDNPIAKWAMKSDKKDIVKFCVDAVLDVNPRANLVLNDFNVSPPDFEMLLEAIQKEGVGIKAIGIQSHMHSKTWTLEETANILDRYKKYRLPLHFTELSVLSGKSLKEVNFHVSDDNEWITADEDYIAQAEYVKDFYTLLFSSPEVEAITWWDFPDGNWLRAPSGLVTQDLKAKPAYDALKKLIREKWWTNANGATDETGTYKCRAFCGTYEISVRIPEAKEISVVLDVNKNGGVFDCQEIVVGI